MPKTTTIDHTCVLKMALVGYQIERSRIEAAIAEIQNKLGQDDSGRSDSRAKATTEPKATGKKRFSAAARKRMAAAQRKRWAELKAKTVAAKKAKPTAPAKRQKAAAAATARKRLAQVKAARTTAAKSKATRQKAPKAKFKDAAVETHGVVNETVAPNVPAAEPVPAPATA